MSLASSSETPPAERLLVVGLGACDQAVVERLGAAGQLPHIAAVVAGGASGRLRPTRPQLRESVWATLATGCWANRHRVLASWVPRQDGGGVMPVGHASWQAPAFWEWLEAAGLPTLTLGWPGTAPATASPGTHVDARFALPTGPDFAGWALPRDVASPATLPAQLRPLRVHPTDIEGSMLLPFVPRLQEVDQYRDSRLVALAVALAEASTLHAAATALVEAPGWTVASVQYDWLEQVESRFRDAESDGPFAGVVDAAYAFADALLGRLLALAGPGTAVWLICPSGLRAAGTDAAWRGHGFHALRAAGVAPGSGVPASRPVDIAATLLARYGLAAPMDGRPLRDLVPEGATLRRLDPPARAPAAPDEHVATLTALGYSDAPPPAGAALIDGAEAAQRLALADALIAQGRLAEAEANIRAARNRLPPENPNGLLGLALCLFQRGALAEAREVGQTVRQQQPQGGWGDLILAACHAAAGDATAARRHMVWARERGDDQPELFVRLGGIALMLGEDLSAKAHFLSALRLDPDSMAAKRGLAMADELAPDAAPAIASSPSPAPPAASS